MPDDEDKKSPVLLLGVNKITDSPSFVRRRSIEGSNASGSIRFYRPPKSKYTRGLQGDERLEKIRQDLLNHKSKEKYIPSTSNDQGSIKRIEEKDKKNCLKLNCAGNCKACNKNSSNRGSFLFHRPENRQSSLCPSEPYGVPEQVRIDYSENDIEFKYTEHIPNSQHPCSSKQSCSYNVTPKSAERRHFLLANLNERFRKTLSLDSRKIDRLPLSLPPEPRPKSLINTSNIVTHFYKPEEPFSNSNLDKQNNPKKKKFRPKSFFSLETFFDSKKSDSSSVDDHSSSKYKKFELESDDSPLFHSDVNTSRYSQKREKTPDLLNLPVIIDSVRKKQTDPKRQLEKLENHYYKSLGRTVIDAVPKDAKDVQGPSNRTHHILFDDDDVEYIEPIRSNFTSQSTLILDSKGIPQDSLKPDSILTINTDETDIKLPSSTVSPKSNAEICVHLENDIDNIGAYEIEIKETDLLKSCSKDLTVKIMDKSIDSIGSCSLDVDASTDFSGTA